MNRGGRRCRWKTGQLTWARTSRSPWRGASGEKGGVGPRVAHDPKLYNRGGTHSSWRSVGTYPYIGVSTGRHEERVAVATRAGLTSSPWAVWSLDTAHSLRDAIAISQIGSCRAASSFQFPVHTPNPAETRRRSVPTQPMGLHCLLCAAMLPSFSLSPCSMRVN